MIRQDWPHQTWATDEVVRRIEAGEKSMCLTAVTGSGKSVIIQRLLEYSIGRGWQAAVLTNRKLLTSQLSRGLSDSGIHLGVRAATFESWTDPTAPIQVCSAPTETARVFKRRERAMQRLVSEEDARRDHTLFPAQIVFVDECHMQKGDSTIAILDEYKAKHDAVLVGVTATPLGISHIYDDLVIACNNSQARSCGALVPAYCYEPASFDIWKIRRTKSGVYSQQELEDRVKAIWSQHVVASVFDSWKSINKDGKPSLCFAPGVKESLGLAMDFERRGVKAAHISGEGFYVDGKEYQSTEQSDRDELFCRLKSGDVKVCVNRFVLREAVDLPWIECISLATPIAALTSFLQVVGRGLRASPSTGKDRCLLIDHGGAVRMHGSPNADFDEVWRTYWLRDTDAPTKDRLDKLRDPDCHEPEPITCPECGMIRKSGPKCPGCQHQHSTSIRRVIQENGTLKLTKGDVWQKRRTRVKHDTAKVVEAAYFRCKNASKPMSFKQMRGLIRREAGYWCPLDMPYFPKNKSDLGRKITAVAFADLIPKPAPR